MKIECFNLHSLSSFMTNYIEFSFRASELNADKINLRQINISTANMQRINLSIIV